MMGALPSMSRCTSRTASSLLLSLNLFLASSSSASLNCSNEMVLQDLPLQGEGAQGAPTGPRHGEEALSSHWPGTRAPPRAPLTSGDPSPHLFPTAQSESAIKTQNVPLPRPGLQHCTQ